MSARWDQRGQEMDWPGTQKRVGSLAPSPLPSLKTLHILKSDHASLAQQPNSLGMLNPRGESASAALPTWERQRPMLEFRVGNSH